MAIYTQLETNKNSLNEILETVQNLPEAGTNLPELTNPATAEDLLKDKELIDGNGNKVTGTFSIDPELTTQDSLITQIQTVLQDKATYNTIYIGSTAPTTDVGVNGDIYIIKG